MTDATVIDHLKRRIAQANLELAKAVEDRKRSQQQESMLLKEIAGYESALAAEERRGGIRAATTTEGSVPPPLIVAGAPLGAPNPSTNGHPTNATHAIYEFIRAAGVRGITRLEIKGRLEVDGIQVHPNYPYVVVAKLKEANRIKEESGRLYAL